MEIVGKEKLTQLIKELLAKKDVNISMRQIGLVLNATLEGIADTVRRGDSVQLLEFGTFFSRERAKRQGRNIATGEPCVIPEMRTVVFHPARALKDSMNP